MCQTFCAVVPVLLGVAIAGTGRGNEPPKPDSKPKVVREQVTAKRQSCEPANREFALDNAAGRP
jgi:hypothetical protein